MKRFLIILLALVSGMLIFASCNVEQPIEQSQYKKDNDAFVAQAEQKGYKKKFFLNANYPFYYKVLHTSSKAGAKYPYQGSTVSINLSGKLITGEEFQQMGTITIELRKLINGMQYALQSMVEGDRWEVVIPYQIGYNDNYMRPPTIPLYSTLIFDVELLEVTVQ